MVSAAPTKDSCRELVRLRGLFRIEAYCRGRWVLKVSVRLQAGLFRRSVVTAICSCVLT
jgi:hypothetical protein